MRSEPIRLSNRQARRFLLRDHGLLGAHRFTGKQGALDYVRKTRALERAAYRCMERLAKLNGCKRVELCKDMAWGDCKIWKTML